MDLDYKFQVLKKLKIWRICKLLPNYKFLETARSQTTPTAFLLTTLTDKPISQMRACLLYWCMKPYHSAESRTFISLWLKFHLLIFLLPKLNVCIYSVSLCVYLCSKFCDLKQMSNEKLVLKFGTSQQQGAKTSFLKEIVIFFVPNVS